MQKFDDVLDTLSRNMYAAGRVPLGRRADGRLIWPIFGATGPAGGESGEGGQGGAGGNGNQGAGQGGSGGAGNGSDLGYPPSTPVADMTVQQQVAYWQHQARKHEDRNRAYDNLTPEQLKELRDKAAKQDALEVELGTTAEKAAAEAAAKATKEAADKYEPVIARTAIHAAAATSGLNVEAVDNAIKAGFTDLRQFVTDGQVNTDRVKAYIESITPARGETERRGPTGAGAGRHTTSQTGSARDRGKAEAQKRFGKAS